jgi:hypothetical protein
MSDLIVDLSLSGTIAFREHVVLDLWFSPAAREVESREG